MFKACLRVRELVCPVFKGFQYIRVRPPYHLQLHLQLWVTGAELLIVAWRVLRRRVVAT